MPTFTILAVGTQLDHPTLNSSAAHGGLMIVGLDDSAAYGKLDDKMVQTIGILSSSSASYSREDYDKESDNFKRFVADAEQPLFEGSECTKLESVLKLHNWKARFGVSDKAFTDLLQSIGSILPKDNLLPSNMYEAKKTLTDLGLEYIKFHACPNDCVLYRGPILESSSECPKCHLSRWKVGKDGQVRVNVPAKVMWYFPIIPRFKRMFKSSSTAELMSWHANNRSKDGKMRHPSDSPSWRNVDCRWPEFGSEARNIRLGLAADGPQEPGNDIDVYLQPLIDDLKKLWEEGEPNVYDAHTKSFFTLKAILMWTINDFPGYGNLSGYVNKGYRACPVCGDQTVAKYLSRSRKMSYQGHRRYLDLYHPYRRQRTTFNGEQEFGCAPEPLSGEEVLGQQQQLRFSFGKGEAKKGGVSMEKQSVFFELEYWKFHHVRHCLDVMHVEKNVCDNIIGTLLHMKFKSKDSLASRLDLVDMGIRPDLAPEVGEKRTYLPPAPYTLSRKEKQIILASLYDMKLPYGHASNIRNCVSMIDMKLYGLKSHDCHILLQQLLPVCIRSVLPKNVRSYVRNRLYPEGSIAEGYLKEESIEFCSEFYSGSSRTTGLPKDEEKISGPIGGVTMKSVAEKERDEAHLSVLRNNSEVEPYVMLHKKYLEEIYRGKKKSVQWLLGEHNRQFTDWFEQKVSTEMRENAEAVSETIRWFAGKPSFSVLTYESYAVEGVRYHTKDRDNARVVQNSGVSLVARTVQVSSAKDMNPIESDLKFYGVIREIWELDYHAFKAPLFLCTWAASNKGVKSDDLGFTLVNFNRPGHKKDKYVSVDQVNQVFYIEDPVDANWSVVLSATTRDYHDVYNEDAPEDTSWNPPPFCSNIPTCDPAKIDDASVCNRRENVEGIWVKKL
ncbi:uncharacterized protein LOC141666335 [Apium graveolens]|uniref:uncharacterized protein LOC141666335 n=1 Tax=Apium graveolens TaxID=4045 RepID=UPI003D797EA6